MHIDIPYPHEGGCPGCRELFRCNYCGSKLERGMQCTNGRCPTCHQEVCTPGGATSTGHGYGGPPVSALRADYQSWHDRPHAFVRKAHGGTGCATCGYGPGAYFHNPDAPDFPDKVANTKEGWAVRFHGCIEGARWQDEGAARAHLALLQSGARIPQPEIQT